MAVADDELPRAGLHLRRARRQLAERKEQAAWKARELVLPGLPHVDEQRLFAALELAREVVDRDLPGHRHWKSCCARRSSAAACAWSFAPSRTPGRGTGPGHAGCFRPPTARCPRCLVRAPRPRRVA